MKELEHFFGRQASTCLKSNNDNKSKVCTHVYKQFLL